MLRKSLMLTAAIGMATASAATAREADGTDLGSSTGAVFAATNGVSGNEIIMYHRGGRGALKLVGKFQTGGRGEGGVNDPLQSSGSIIVTPDHAFLLAANAGSSDISVFRILPDGLALASLTPSGGGNPVSIAVHDNLVYVVDTGGDIHTAGFVLDATGRLTRVPKSAQSLSTLDTGASTAVFSPDGTKLIVTERLTNRIDVFSVDPDGSLSDPVFNASAGTDPFGATFSLDGALLVTEAQSGSTSSYSINPDNTLTTITSKAASGGGATCWIAVNGRNAWVSNTTTSDIGAYDVAQDGSLQPLGVVATVTTNQPTLFPPVKPPTSFPIDLALSADDQYLYVVYSATGSLVGYSVGAGGALKEVAAVPAVQAQSGAEGLAAF